MAVLQTDCFGPFHALGSATENDLNLIILFKLVDLLHTDISNELSCELCAIFIISISMI